MFHFTRRLAGFASPARRAKWLSRSGRKCAFTQSRTNSSRAVSESNPVSKPSYWTLENHCSNDAGERLRVCSRAAVHSCSPGGVCWKACKEGIKGGVSIVTRKIPQLIHRTVDRESLEATRYFPA